MKAIVLTLFLMLLLIPPSLAAHFIIGEVGDALDGTDSDGLMVTLWKSLDGPENNLTDIIGAEGNSGQAGFYMIDCELLAAPCGVGESMTLKVFNEGNGYATKEINVTVTGAGFDIAPSLRLNSPAFSQNITIQDGAGVLSEIDLVAGSTKEIFCEAAVMDYDGDSIGGRAEFFDSSVSNYGGIDLNKEHYTNSSCFIDENYGGENDTLVRCGFSVLYYAASGDWSCEIELDDGIVNSRESNQSFINPLLSIGTSDLVDFGTTGSNEVSSEVTINVTNYGNVNINLSLSGYALTEGDGLAMDCDVGNISIDYKKYNLTESNFGEMDLLTFGENYKNLSSAPFVNLFNFAPRQSDEVNDAVRETFWRIFVPAGVSGSCIGNIVFGAGQLAGL